MDAPRGQRDKSMAGGVDSLFKRADGRASPVEYRAHVGNLHGAPGRATRLGRQGALHQLRRHAVIRPFCITILHHNSSLFIDIFHIMMQYLCYFISFCMFGNYWGCICRSRKSAGKVPVKIPGVGSSKNFRKNLTRNSMITIINSFLNIKSKPLMPTSGILTGTFPADSGLRQMNPQ